MHNILFVCTANIFRSRFAEEVFNFLALEERIPAKAFSAGLKVGEYHVRKIHRPALEQLEKLNIKPKRPNELSVHIDEVELTKYDQLICMDEAEHKSMVLSNSKLKKFNFEYWYIIDEPKVQSDVSLPICYSKVKKLVDDLKNKIEFN
tara:strand:- start:230 stop:673 length:444 start_codon:yes stop_codon:yes gene_type:complete